MSENPSELAAESDGHNMLKTVLISVLATCTDIHERCALEPKTKHGTKRCGPSDIALYIQRNCWGSRNKEYLLSVLPAMIERYRTSTKGRISFSTYLLEPWPAFTGEESAADL
jgi:hypothetical protein